MEKRELRKKVGLILENEYKLDIGTTEKVLEMFFSQGYIPRWYFYRNSANTIARNIYLYTQLLNANSRYLESASEDGKTITYFVNVGRDTPGRLERLIEENIDMGIGSFDAEYTKSGISIVSITKKGRSEYIVPEDQWDSIKNTLREAEKVGREKGLKYYDKFLSSIPLDYLSEEVTAHSPSVRLYRHMEYYDKALSNDHLNIFEDFAAKKVGDKKESNNEKRLALSIKNPDDNWVKKVLQLLEIFEVSVNRVYYDLLEGDDNVAILSVYVEPETDLTDIVIKLEESEFKTHEISRKDALSRDMDNIIRSLTTLNRDDDRFKDSMDNLINLCNANSDINIEGEYKNFYLNSVSDFMEACRFLGIDKNYKILSYLLGFEGLDEFFVSCRENNKTINKPGFRAKHNSVRGPSKGGLRIDSIVRYDEVAALSFMMTWKCARSGILFGGGKGGLKINPNEFSESKIDFFDTLSNFGRSIFCVTGPSRDVPAGDVGCGAKEIGHLFEGFKSALRDLALLAYGVKKGIAMIGNNLISVEEARSILYNNFDIDYLDKRILKELSTAEEYLNLVTAAQITGKPKMGIEARTGATGRGLCYSILQTVTNLYLDSMWSPSQELTESEVNLLKYTESLSASELKSGDNSTLISDSQWRELNESIYKKLLRGKKVAVQGSGKVGSSIMKELSQYNVNIVAVADAMGAIVGNNLNIKEILSEANGSSRSVIGCKEGVEKVISGAKEGSSILTMECDILIPAALENAITQENAYDIKCKVVACGSNGPSSTKAEKILNIRGITLIYDFLANGAGVTASYFEWLRNLHSRFFYEATKILNEPFDIKVMEKYIMPDFKGRIEAILSLPEGEKSTAMWNMLIRDIIFIEINEDYKFSKSNKISMKSAGFVDSILKVITATLIKIDNKSRLDLWNEFDDSFKKRINSYFKREECRIFTDNLEQIKKELFL